MSKFSSSLGVLAVSGILAGPVGAQTQDNPVCTTSNTVASHALTIIDNGCGQNDEYEGSFQCNLALLRVIQLLESCGESGEYFRDKIEQQYSSHN